MYIYIRRQRTKIYTCNTQHGVYEQLYFKLNRFRDFGNRRTVHVSTQLSARIRRYFVIGPTRCVCIVRTNIFCVRAHTRTRLDETVDKDYII